MFKDLPKSVLRMAYTHVYVTGYRYIYTLVQPCCISRLLWRCGRVSDCHPVDPGSIPIWVRSEDIFLYLSHLAPNVGPNEKSSYSPVQLFQQPLLPGSSGTKPNLVGENVTGYRYTYTLVQPCCTSRLLGRCGRVSDCHPGDLGSIPFRVRSEDIFLHLSHINAKKCLTNAVYNFTNALRMKQQHEVCVLYAYTVLSVFLFFLYLPAPAQSAYSHSNFAYCPHSSFILYEC